MTTNQDLTPLLEVDSVTKIYTHNNKTTYALNGVSLKVMPHDIYGIIGLSGAGKSTLLRCMAGLIKPTSGKILFQNQDISSLSKEGLRCFYLKIGMIFQHFNLLSSRTVAGNIAYPLEIAGVPKQEQEKRIHELLDLVGLLHKKKAYPISLSGGEKQRVGIARALAHQPEILFCDEATSALDPKTTQDILELLKQINQKLGVSIILITHDKEVIKKVCNKMAVIEKGDIVEQGLVSHMFTQAKHPTTQQFMQGSPHQIPQEFFEIDSPNRKLVRLKFQETAASEPLISQIIKKYHVDANILLGWIDRLHTTTVGTLIVELTGQPENITEALDYLNQKTVQHEVLRKL